MTDDRLAKVLAAGKTGGRHSSLYLWMRENHATLAADFAANGPRWDARFKAMGEVGLLDADGKKPSKRTAMQTWYRLCRKQSGPPASPQPTNQPAAQPGAAGRPPPEPTAPTIDRPYDNPYGFKLGLDHWTKPG
jgi:hypothetical protein